MAGSKIVPEVAAHYPDLIDTWITPEDGAPPPLDVPWLSLSKALFDELDTFETRGPLVVVKVSPMAAFDDAAPWPEGCTLFLGFQNPDNVGAIVRSAVAMGVSRIVLLKGAALPHHPKAMRAAGPALLAASFLKGPSIRELKIKGAPLFALDAGGTVLSSATFPARFGLLPGVEGPGLPTELEDAVRLSIPMVGGVESLNAATATAIALYEWRRRSKQ
jgi:16S rRNA (guanine527-N7)-methyltransferase